VPQVDFYVLAQASDAARLKLACRITERAYLAGQRVLALAQDEQQLRSFDDLLWTFGERAFVPHELWRDTAGQPEAPVLLASGALPQTASHAAFDLLVNLGADALALHAQVARIAEVLDADPARRSAGRARFRGYREAGIEPRTHTLATEADLPSQDPAA
jgi:DNA polymerase-3 subunit chi